jgi:mannose-6-phosphate isomerase-like protein (cupin superfamily)
VPVAHYVTSLAQLGTGFLRSIRRPLNLTAFGGNVIVLPPDTEWFAHYHERQDELYFVHSGRAGFEVGGETFAVPTGGFVHVESTTPRRFWNDGDEDLVMIAIGGKDGYVERDGQLVDAADLERRAAASQGDVSAIRRRPLTP